MPGIPETGPERNDWRLILLSLAVFVYLYLDLFSFPHTPFLLAGDQSFFWMGGSRMLDGERIYRDFFQFAAPGTDVVFLAAFKLFGLNLWVVNAVVLALGLALAGMCFAMARALMSRWSSALAAAFFVVLIYGKLLTATHHCFSALAIMGAIKVYSGKERPAAVRTLLSGAILGVASFFTQTHGAVALLAFAIVLLWQQSRDARPWPDFLRGETLLFLGYLAALLLLSAPFIAASGWKQTWYCQVVYVVEYAAKLSRSGPLGLPGPLTLRTLPKLSQYLAVYLLVSFIYPITLWRCWRERANPSFPWQPVVLLATVGLLLSLEVTFSLNWMRLYALSMPAVILLIWSLDRMKLRRYAYAVLWCGIAAVAAWQPLSARIHQPLLLHLPAGEVATSQPQFDKLDWMMLHTQPGQYLFQTAGPGMYLQLRLRNPAYVDQLFPAEGTPPGEVELTIRQLDEKQVPYILWASRLDSASSSPQNPKDNLAPIRGYLHTNYSQLHVFPDGDQVWQRNEVPRL